MIYLGLDPGASGGIAVISADGLVTHAMPVTEHDVWDLFIPWIGVPAFATIEHVTGYVGNEGDPGSAMFKFGMNVGLLRMALIAACIPFEQITPGVWQKAVGIPSRKPHTHTVEVTITKGKHKGEMKKKRVGGETTNEFKNRLKAFAQRLFPMNHITRDTADAVLIAVYNRRKHDARVATGRHCPLDDGEDGYG